jgi:hypothetical protein
MIDRDIHLDDLNEIPAQLVNWVLVLIGIVEIA